MKMTVKYVQGRVAEIAAICNDSEKAHAMEDALHLEFIKFAAATSKGMLGKTAREVLKTNKLGFHRWCG